ncbi:MAG: hypothetical protein IPM02_21520 [Betaproteobacteria bacterium]|nr:hypothetical protein [Betaproteobacteria bacterium]
MAQRQAVPHLIASDRRQPTVNAYGPLYGAPEYSTDVMPILDPKTHTATTFRMPVRDADMPESLGPGHAASIKPLQPSAYWGEEKIWDTRANNHNSMFDKQGRVWMAATVRGTGNPAFCRKDSEHPSAKVFPLERSSRQVALFDPKTMKYTFVDTCFGTHHPQFGYDASDTLWLSGSGPVAGWVNTKVFDETGDATKAQGWSPFVLDTNGNGRRDDWAEPNQPVDPAKDKRIPGGPYAVMPSPVDGSIWYTVGVFGGTPAVLRFVPETGLSENLQRPRRDSAFAAATSTRTASSGRRSPAGISAASTAGSARARSTARRRPATTVQRAGRSISIRGRASQGWATTAPNRATTPGSTSTTPRAWARTSRCPPPISTTASSR